MSPAACRFACARTRTRALRLPGARALLLALTGAAACHAPGTSQEVGGPAGPATYPESFDLLVFGHDFDAGEHEVFLRTNLDLGAEWVSLGPLAADGGADGRWSTTVFPGLGTARFLGQDFRERYLDLRIVTAGQGDGSRIAAVYAMPHVAGAAPSAVTRLIEEDPHAVDRLSIASHVQPAPATLAPGTTYIEHVRSPMKHTLPGVAEVEQLRLEWRNRTP